MKYTQENYSLQKYMQDKKLVDNIHLRIPCFGQARIEDVPELVKILKEYGYSGLRVNSNGEENAIVPFSKLIYRDPKRILETSKTTYSVAVKRIKKFGDPSKRIKKTVESKVEGAEQLSLF